MSRLSPRQQAIFHRVVDTHIETAQPVASKSITMLYQELYQDSYSSATVRSEMGQLEKMGYLTHPHTSAGRIPTGKGYRYYVNHTLQETRLGRENDVSLNDNEMDEDPDSANERYCQKLSDLTDEVAVIVSPMQTLPRYKARLKFYLQGSSHILEKPEFRNLEKTKRLLGALEDRDDITDWLVSDREKTSDVQVSIGEENRKAAFEDCSVISALFRTRNDQYGAIAVIGPMRLRYQRVIPLVAHMAQRMSKALDY